MYNQAMNRTYRYQAAILQDNHILLIQHLEYGTGRSYWLLPGGGIEPIESEEDCVQREVWEETGLRVKVERLLMDEPELVGAVRRKTYLCIPLSGEASPGYEPEPELVDVYRIAEVRWLNLLDESCWDEAVKSDRFTYPELKRLRRILNLDQEPE